MKSRLLICVMLLALFALPAMADTITLTNLLGNVSAGSGGISGTSLINSLTFDGVLIEKGVIGTLQFDTGMLTGSHGSFTAGDFRIGAVISANNFRWDLGQGGQRLVRPGGHFLRYL